MIAKRVLVVVLLTCCALSSAQSHPAADLIVSNAKVWTGNKSHPHAEAVAVIADRIVAVGSNAELDAWRGAQTKLIDAQGKLLMPGFNDAHVHFISGGAQLDQVDLKDAGSPEEFARRIGSQAAKTPKGEWVLGGNWDEQKWTPAEMPKRELIDALTPNTPVFVNRYDGHMALANSLALKLAGVTSKTPDPPGGTIVRDAKGNPTGVLKDAAMEYVNKVIPPMSRERRLRAARRALEHAASLGVTSVQDMSLDYADIAVYSELAERDELQSRIYAAPALALWQDQAKLGLRRAWGSYYLRTGVLKGYTDGSLGAATAYMFAPFADDPKNRGLLSEEMTPPSKMRERIMNADAAGLQLAIHAIGDQAISMALDIFADVGRINGERDRRFRIEHAQHMAAKDFARFAKLQVIASMQPYHTIDDGRWAEKRLGPERAKTTYAFRTFLDQGVKLAVGTDWPVAPLSPMLTIYAAATRATLDGRQPNGWVPEEKISVAEAVETYTLGSAFAEFQEKEKGSITAGKLADMVLLSDDIFSIRPEAIRDVQVVTTIVGGKVVYSTQ